MKRLIEQWNGYWFPTTTTLNLACCRIITVAAQLLWFWPTLDRHLNLVIKNPVFVDPQVMLRAISLLVPRNALFTPGGITALYWLTIVAGVTALIGLFTRTSLFIFALGIWFFVSHKYSYGDVHHPESLFAIFIMTLAFAPSGRRLSIDGLIRRTRGLRAGRRIGTPLIWPCGH